MFVLLKEEITHRLREIRDDFLEELTGLCEPLWETGMKVKTLRSVLMPGTFEDIRYAQVICLPPCYREIHPKLSSFCKIAAIFT